MKKLNRRDLLKGFAALPAGAGAQTGIAGALPPAAIRERASRAKPVPHSLLTEHPGRVALDLWGWETSPYYQRSGRAAVSPAYLEKRAIAESWKWGANLVEIYRGGYPLEQRAGWSAESTAALHRAIHERDMTVHWFPHRLDSYAPPREDEISHVSDGAQDSSNTFPGAIEAVRRLGREQQDALRVPPDELLDGLGTEQWPAMPAPLFQKCMGPYNPALYFYTDNHAFDETLPNEIDVSASNGTGSDDQTTGYYQLRPEIRKRYGLQFWGSQAECRAIVPKNAFGGLGRPDWILKQANDQFRVRARMGDEPNLSPSAIWWINEAEDTCPEENRRYVYGISQDPVKCAVTASFATLGEGGFEAGSKRVPRRYPFPARAAFIQNNYLRVVALPDQDRAVLWHDLERLAHYDGNSCAVPLCDSLCRTTMLAGDDPASVKTVRFEHTEVAGCQAVLKTQLALVSGEMAIDEMRHLKVVSDTPYVRLRIERSVSGPAAALGTEIGLPAYDRMILGQTAHDKPVRISPASILRFQDSSGLYPELVVMILARGRLKGICWTPGKGLTLESAPARRDSIELALVVPGGLYEGEDLGQLRAFLSAPDDRVALDRNGQASVNNLFGIPLVKVVRVSAAGSEPYQVFEFGRWVFRGAQPSLLHPGEDYIKCHLPARGAARIQRYGFLEGVARPGWGCQYAMTLSELQRQGGRSSAVAEVTRITSFLFAPRLRFPHPVSGVLVNGKPWHYFDGEHVFLPNRRGKYKVEVANGSAATPCLARTFAHVDSTAFENGRLTFQASLPEWVTGIPEDFHFTALVRHPGRSLTGLNNARLVRTRESAASIVAFRPGAVSLSFDGQAASKPVPRLDADADIEDHLNRLSAGMVLPCVKPFTTVSPPPPAFSGCNVLIWNHYFLDSLPASCTVSTVEALGEYVRSGGGLFLIANAIRLVPWLTGTGVDDARTIHVGHHLDTTYESFGIAPAVPDHPAFRGFPPGPLPLIAPTSVDIVKRVVWPGAAGGRVLAEMHAELKPGGTPSGEISVRSPVLWEWRMGKGIIVAYGCGLRCLLGSSNRWVPSENLLRLAHNVVRYLAQGAPEIRVAVL